MTRNSLSRFGVGVLAIAAFAVALGAVGRPSAQAAPTGAAFPLSVSSNGRYLVDHNGAPFLMVGDSPQSAIGNLSESEADRYFADREAHGFNAVWINLLCDSYTFCHSDGTTTDGLRPFTTGTSPSSYDLSTPTPRTSSGSTTSSTSRPTTACSSSLTRSRRAGGSARCRPTAPRRTSTTAPTSATATRASRTSSG
jgi:uncharacterized protein DUF4038